MSTFTVATSSDNSLSIDLECGDVLFVLGANGTGKSTLLYNWVRGGNKIQLIAGNRDISFAQAGVSLSAADSITHEESARNHSRVAKSRFGRAYHNNDRWLSTLLFRIKARGEYLNNEYRKADICGRVGDKEEANRLMPVNLLNHAFATANLPISLDWNDKSELIVTKTGVTGQYGFNEMSDGERSAFILTASTILAEQNSTLLIDEPERHLHRSISCPLLSCLQELRRDLTWVIATHDLTIPADYQNSKILALYDYDGATWEADLIENDGVTDPTIAAAIHGARQRVLFVEGDRDNSLDLPLYSLLFPNITIVPAGSCNDVRQAVKSLKNITKMHHMKPYGLVDSDNRPDLERLRGEGVYPLGVYAIESIYYHPMVIGPMLELAGTDLNLAAVTEEACSTINDGIILKLAKDKAYKGMRSSIDGQIPSFDIFCDSTECQTIEVFNPAEKIGEIKIELGNLVAEKNWEALLVSVKIKASPAPKTIATLLGYLNAGAYEKAARKLLKTRPEILSEMKTLAPVEFG